MTATRTSYGTVFACSDGATRHEKIRPFALAQLGVEDISLHTELGMDSILAGYKHKRFETELLPTMIERLRQSAVFEHVVYNTKAVLILGHANCPWVMGPSPRHRDVLARAVETVRSWHIHDIVKAAYVDSKHEILEVLS